MFGCSLRGGGGGTSDIGLTQFNTSGGGRHTFSSTWFGDVLNTSKASWNLKIYVKLI